MVCIVCIVCGVVVCGVCIVGTLLVYFFYKQLCCFCYGWGTGLQSLAANLIARVVVQADEQGVETPTGGCDREGLRCMDWLRG